MTTITRSMALPAIAAAALLAAGCHFPHARVEETRSEIRTVEANGAELVRAEIRMGAGELNLRGGASKLLDADFRYNVAAWKPDVRYEKTGFRGQLTVSQPEAGSTAGDTVNEWKLRLANNVPLDLDVVIGAGEAKVDLGGLSMRSARLKLGAGEVEVEFSEPPKKSFELQIRGGVGEATVRLPRDTGVIARAKGGIGDIDVTNLIKEGDHWVNEAYGKSKVTLTVDVEGGIGQIRLIGQ